jgi:hypothetical protein
MRPSRAMSTRATRTSSARSGRGAARSTMAAKNRSGSYVHEAQRHTERVVLRLPPAVAEELRRRAARQGQTVSAHVAALVQSEDKP